MSQDNGANKEDAKAPFEKTVGQVEQRLGIDPDSTQDNPPQSEHHLGEDNPPPQSDSKGGENNPQPPSGHHLSGCAIAAIVIAAIFIVLGVTCFALMNIK
jgi:hypothetical protein